MSGSFAGSRREDVASPSHTLSGDTGLYRIVIIVKAHALLLVGELDGQVPHPLPPAGPGRAPSLHIQQLAIPSAFLQLTGPWRSRYAGGTANRCEDVSKQGTGLEALQLRSGRRARSPLAPRARSLAVLEVTTVDFSALEALPARPPVAATTKAALAVEVESTIWRLALSWARSSSVSKHTDLWKTVGCQQPAGAWVRLMLFLPLLKSGWPMRDFSSNPSAC